MTNKQHETLVGCTKEQLTAVRDNAGIEHFLTCGRVSITKYRNLLTLLINTRNKKFKRNLAGQVYDLVEQGETSLSTVKAIKSVVIAHQTADPAKQQVARIIHKATHPSWLYPLTIGDSKHYTSCLSSGLKLPWVKWSALDECDPILCLNNLEEFVGAKLKSGSNFKSYVLGGEVNAYLKGDVYYLATGIGIHEGGTGYTARIRVVRLKGPKGTHFYLLNSLYGSELYVGKLIELALKKFKRLIIERRLFYTHVTVDRTNKVPRLASGHLSSVYDGEDSEDLGFYYVTGLADPAGAVRVKDGVRIDRDFVPTKGYAQVKGAGKFYYASKLKLADYHNKICKNKVSKSCKQYTSAVLATHIYIHAKYNKLYYYTGHNIVVSDLVNAVGSPFRTVYCPSSLIWNYEGVRYRLDFVRLNYNTLTRDSTEMYDFKTNKWVPFVDLDYEDVNNRLRYHLHRRHFHVLDRYLPETL